VIRPVVAPDVTKTLRAREAEVWATLTSDPSLLRPTVDSALAIGDSIDRLNGLPENVFHAVVTDPPYGLVEYETKDHAKLVAGKGGVWRVPPTLDGSRRAPVPRFTVLDEAARARLADFIGQIAGAVSRTLVPGGHLIIASNPLVSSLAFQAIEAAGFEKRGEIIRLTATLRGGDRPKGAEAEFADVTVMPRSRWEPWGLFRKPLSEPTVSANLRRWGAGGLRRVSDTEPFGDLIASAPTRARERAIAPHPSLKPQKLMRALVRGALPLGLGIVCDPFAGGGSTLAAATRLGVRSFGVEINADYAELAIRAIRDLSELPD